MTAPTRDPLAYLEALALALNSAFANVRAIESNIPSCTPACGHLGDALAHLESARGCVQAARVAFDDQPNHIAAE